MLIIRILIAFLWVVFVGIILACLEMGPGQGKLSMPIDSVDADPQVISRMPVYRELSGSMLASAQLHKCPFFYLLRVYVFSVPALNPICSTL